MHQKKLSWHIRRLYRTRNLIVHDSGTMYDIETLVENCHSYVDEFLKQILRLIQKIIVSQLLNKVLVILI